eukprot:09061.XXX_513587_513688_1 [CDS] Oithona nana genome sequencing.
MPKVFVEFSCPWESLPQRSPKGAKHFDASLAML